jgi:predicted dehydrogenase
MWRDGRTEDLGASFGTGGGADPMAFPCDWHRDLILDFAQSITTHGPPAITDREALRVHALIEAITRSALEERKVEVRSV